MNHDTKHMKPTPAAQPYQRPPGGPACDQPGTDSSARVSLVGRATNLLAAIAFALAGFIVKSDSLAGDLDPVLRGSLTWESEQKVAALAIRDNLAFVLFVHAGLAILDLNDPAQPKQIGSYRSFEADVSWSTASLSVVGNFVYVVDLFNGLQIIDATEPSQPYQVGAFNGEFLDGKVSGGFAYLISGQYDAQTFQTRTRIEVIDLGDPAAPRRVGELETEGWFGSIDVMEPFVYIVGNGALDVVDVSDPTSLRTIGSYRREGAGDWFDVAVHETTAYVAMNSDHAPGQMNGVGILDVADPASPQWVSRADAGIDPWRLAVTDDLVFVQGFYGVMKVIDVGNRASPRRVGGYDTDDTGFSVGAVETFGSFVCVANSFGFQIIEVHKPAQVTRVGSGVTTLIAEDVAVDGHFAYVVDRRHPPSLQMVDVSDPTNPELMGRYEYGGNADRVRVFGRFAYLAGSFEWGGGSRPGLLVIDVSDPHNPQRAGGYPISSTTYPINQLAVSSAGDLVFLDTGDGGLQVIDVSDPNNPTRTEDYELEGVTWVFSVLGGVEYAHTRSGLEVFDVINPAAPRRIAGNSAFRARAVFAHGDHVYVAGDNDGLIILNRYTELRIGPAIVLSDGRVLLQLSGASGQCVRVQRSANLIDWEDWHIVTLDGTGCELIDETAVASQRFYRAVEDSSLAVK
jgi:hypothetical protein